MKNIKKFRKIEEKFKKYENSEQGLNGSLSKSKIQICKHFKEDR